ncbi:amino acid permease [Diplodia corticola]|uniref:Amino acid permease n=1 Tax=Diplodia corticola TaxID=236234 RepID=A0A1J9QRS5_9PEZI|nr:amino acid permease [Diplodia corticola]OJD31152.1 amino acid permease [Diplodia corticola]
MGKPDPEDVVVETSPSPAESQKGETFPIASHRAGIEEKYGTTKRGLSGRHVQLISIGGAVGTGLFVAIGSHLRSAGPLNVLLAFIIYPIVFVFPCYLCVAEMSAYLPIRGSIYEFATRFVDPAFGFMLGWTYFYAASMLFCAELSAVATVMQYWSDVNPAVWIAMALVVCYGLNVFAVKWYGESEFIFSCTKILLILGLIVLTFITMVGGNPKHDAYGFRNWTGGNAMHEYYAEGSTGRFLGWWSCVLYAAFSLGGPDLVAMAAGEIEDPRKNIPRVARNIFLRVFVFYVLGALCVGIICSSRDPRLLGAIDSGEAGAAASPWVIGIQNLGITGLPSLINFLIMLSGWSCGNAYMYSASRTLYSLALDGQAPRFLLKCTKSGIPIYCVSIVGVIGCITFMVASSSATEVFGWFIDLTICSFDIAYTSMVVTWVGWNRALRAQGISRDSLPWKAPFMPYGAYLAIATGLTILVFVGFDVFAPFSVQGFITSYFGVAFAAVAFAVWKVVKKTKFVKPAEADVWSGKAEVDAECKVWEDAPPKPKARNPLVRAWDALW